VHRRDLRATPAAARRDRVRIDPGWRTVTADVFVDGTGFAGILIQKALGTSFVSFSNNLFNDAAIVLPTPIGNDIPSQTISTALKHGCRWKIPLTSRYGNGYVYSSAFCSADDAEHELREGLGMLDSYTPARHMKMKIGRVMKHWNRNCLAPRANAGRSVSGVRTISP
jgi:hypothetical protein